MEEVAASYKVDIGKEPPQEPVQQQMNHTEPVTVNPDVEPIV